MLKELNIVNKKFIKCMKETKGILAAWYFGSNQHGLSDEYSDIDIVLLADEAEYHSIDKNLTDILKELCDDVLLCWGEDFNSDTMKNYDYLLCLNNKIVQYDVFLLNNACINDFMCKLHYTDLKRENIIFAVDDVADALIQHAPQGTLWHDDIKRLIETYWLHIQMSVKYFKRKDFFKLDGILRTLMDTHSSLLLNAYDKITWGGTANKLHYIPQEKQRHLMKYGCIEDYDCMKENFLLFINWFEEDVNEIIKDDISMNNAKELGACIKEYWIRHM